MDGSEHIDAITQAIDAGLEEARVLFMTDDRIRLIENEILQDLNESVAGGWKTQEEADAEFADWRAKHKPIIAVGVTAVEASDDVGGDMMDIPPDMCMTCTKTGENCECKKS